MNELIEITKTVNWLETKLMNREGGILFESCSRSSFITIQNFIESYDRPFQTLVTYYQAFPQESSLEFIDTLGEELASKLGSPLAYRNKPVLDIIKDAGLKMVVIDDCHFHPQDTLEKLLKLFSDCQVSVILVGDREKMAIAKILNHPLVSQWDNLDPNLMI